MNHDDQFSDGYSVGDPSNGRWHISITASKFSKKFFSFFEISNVGKIHAFKIPNMDLLSIKNYFGSKASIFVPENALHASCAIFAYKLVGLVLTSSANSKIRSSVIKPVPIRMINVHSWGRIKDMAMHSKRRYDTITLNFRNCIWLIFDLKNAPVSSLYKRDIAHVDDCFSTMRKRNISNVAFNSNLSDWYSVHAK